MIRAISVIFVFALALPQQNRPPRNTTKQPMTFFIASEGSGDGGNLGGLAGADTICQTRAAAIGGGSHTWHAYLSTQAAAGQPAVNARDRIGQGPWYNQDGVEIAANVADLHGDTLELARKGNNITKRTALTEKGEVLPGVGDPGGHKHDILTGSQPDGRAYTDIADHTCKNWTSNSAGSAQLGHSDRNHNNADTTNSWNSTHPTRDCSPDGLRSTGGAGLIYCFAIN